MGVVDYVVTTVEQNMIRTDLRTYVSSFRSFLSPDPIRSTLNTLGGYFNSNWV